MDEQERRGQGEVEDGEAAVLPAREAMSLITPDVSPSYLPSLDDAAPTDVEAQASGSGEENVTSADRSEHISNEDTAVSET